MPGRLRIARRVAAGPSGLTGIDDEEAVMDLARAARLVADPARDGGSGT
jgi:hypothetical protein